MKTTTSQTVNNLICGNVRTNIYKVEDGSQLSPQPHEKDYLNTHYFFPPFLSFGDYDNSCNVERSNVRVWEEMFEDTRGKDWIKISGWYGQECIGVRLTCTNEEIIETLQALENYPCLNDEDASLVTIEMEEDALDNYLLREFKEKVLKFYQADETDAEDSEFRQLYFDLKEKTNTYETVEAGGNFYIDLDRLIEGLETEKPVNLKLVTW